MAKKPKQHRSAKQTPPSDADLISYSQLVAILPGKTSTSLKTAAFVLVVVVYLYLFFTSNAHHTASLGFVFIPDDLVMEWMGKDTERFGIGDRWLLLACAAAILAVGFATGRCMMGLLRIDRGLRRLETTLLATAVGLHLWSLWTLAIGLAGGLHQPAWFLLPAVGVVVIGAVLVWRGRWRPKGPGRNAVGRLSESSRIKENSRLGESCNSISPKWFWASIPFIVVLVLAGMVPPWEFDVREYHLQIPKEWFRQGRIDFTPHNVYGNMPLGAEMHALLAMPVMPKSPNWWWGAMVGKTVIACFTPLTGLAIFSAGRRFFNASVGVVAMLVYLSLPWVAHVSGAGLIDGVVAFYMFMALYAVLLWGKFSADEDSTGQTQMAPSATGLLILAGILAGAAVSCKYPSLLFVAIPLGIGVFLSGWFLAPWAASGHAQPLQQWPRLHWGKAAVFGTAVAMSCGLWFGKNWLLTGNPTYPLLYDEFGGKTRTDELNQRWIIAHRPPRDSQGRSYTLRHLADSFTQVAWRSDWASPLLAPLVLIAALWSRRRGRLQLALWGLAGFVFLTWWLFTHRIDRFWLPAAPLLALLAGLGADSVRGNSWRVAVGLFFAAGLLINFLAITSRGIGDNRFLVALEDLKSDLPHEKDQYFTRVHPAHRQLNRLVPAGSQVLLVGEATPFDLDPRCVYNTCFDPCQFERIMKGKTRQQRLAELRRLGITHVFIFWKEIERYRQTYGFSDYVTRDLVHQELVKQQGILRPAPRADDPNISEIFEVVYPD